MIQAGIPHGVWQSFLVAQDVAAVDRLVALAQKRIEEWSANGVKPELLDPDRQIIAWAPKVKALF